MCLGFSLLSLCWFRLLEVRIVGLIVLLLHLVVIADNCRSSSTSSSRRSFLLSVCVAFSLFMFILALKSPVSFMCPFFVHWNWSCFECEKETAMVTKQWLISILISSNIHVSAQETRILRVTLEFVITLFPSEWQQNDKKNIMAT